MTDLFDTHHLGVSDYREIWEQMKSYTENRKPNSRDQLWIVQHPPTYTLGKSKQFPPTGLPPHIPVIKTDRGGNITFHGTGQIIAYLLFDLNRRNIGIRSFVRLIEQSIINCLSSINIDSQRIEKRPGIYTKKGKIAALGLCYKRQGTYHGLSLNVDMNLDPFSYIAPCGIQQTVDQIKNWRDDVSVQQASDRLLTEFTHLWEKKQPSS